MDETNVFLRLGIGLGLGLLVGIQRQWKASQLAGIRTFPLITLLGVLMAVVDQHAQTPWLAVAGLLAVAAMLYVGNRVRVGTAPRSPGLTTEMAALLMYGVGVATGYGLLGPSIALGGAVAVLLQFKDQLHDMVGRLTEKDLRAVMQLVLTALVILPVLPNRSFGWYEVLNPFKIWLMVVLIVGISLVGYLAAKLVGPRAGAVLAGLLGGLISSTATTVSYARQTALAPSPTVGSAAVAATVIMIASTVMNVRVLFEVAVVSPALLAHVVMPLGLLSTAMALLSLLLWIRSAPSGHQPLEHANPAQLRPALLFGALYAAILWLSAMAKANFGHQALYFVAALSGLTDMDAITLSTSELVRSQQLDPAIGWRVIFVATISNMAFKTTLAVLLGSIQLRWLVILAMGLALAAAGAIWWYGPIPLTIP